MSIARPLALAACLLLGACSTLSGSDQQRMTLHLENAAQYFDQRHYEPAYQQWGLALEFDPLNDKARLGQAMVLYFLGLEESPLGVERLALAEERLGALRNEDLGGLEWQAELGYALVQDRWVGLHARKVRQLEYERAATGKTDEAQLSRAVAELDRRARVAADAYQTVYTGGEREAQYQLTCMVGLAKMAAYRGDYDAALGHVREYEEQIVRSKRLWRDAVDRYPREAALWQQKLAGAERQEADLRVLTANVLYKLGRLEEAESELDVVLEIDRERESGYLNRGIVRQERRDWDRARQDLRAFLNITERGADDPSVIEAETRLAVVEQRIADEDEAVLDDARRSP